MGGAAGAARRRNVAEQRVVLHGSLLLPPADRSGAVEGNRTRPVRAEEDRWNPQRGTARRAGSGACVRARRGTALRAAAARRDGQPGWPELCGFGSTRQQGRSRRPAGGWPGGGGQLPAAQHAGWHPHDSWQRGDGTGARPRAGECPTRWDRRAGRAARQASPDVRERRDRGRRADVSGGDDRTRRLHERLRRRG